MGGGGNLDSTQPLSRWHRYCTDSLSSVQWGGVVWAGDGSLKVSLSLQPWTAKIWAAWLFFPICFILLLGHVFRHERRWRPKRTTDRGHAIARSLEGRKRWSKTKVMIITGYHKLGRDTEIWEIFFLLLCLNHKWYSIVWNHFGGRISFWYLFFYFFFFFPLTLISVFHLGRLKLSSTVQ